MDSSVEYLQSWFWVKVEFDPYFISLFSSSLFNALKYIKKVCRFNVFYLCKKLKSYFPHAIICFISPSTLEVTYYVFQIRVDLKISLPFREDSRTTELRELNTTRVSIDIFLQTKSILNKKYNTFKNYKKN